MKQGTTWSRWLLQTCWRQGGGLLRASSPDSFCSDPHPPQAYSLPLATPKDPPPGGGAGHWVCALAPLVVLILPMAWGPDAAPAEG